MASAELKMVLTNAQVALLAASSNGTVDLQQASRLKEWLDGQDLGKDIKEGAYQVPDKRPVVQCTAESKMFAVRCLLAEGHASEHRNTPAGVHWTDDEHVTATALKPVHFRPNSFDDLTVCGQLATPDDTVLPGEATCRHCQKELGL